MFFNEPINETLPEFPLRTNNEINDILMTESKIAFFYDKLEKNKSCRNENVHSFVLKVVLNLGQLF